MGRDLPVPYQTHTLTLVRVVKKHVMGKQTSSLLTRTKFLKQTSVNWNLLITTLKVDFMGEESVHVGGPRREWIGRGY